jgi:hypothetical protein
VFDNPCLKAAPVEEEAPNSDTEYDEAEDGRRKNKAKKTPPKTAGKIANTENFWGRVNEWFKEQIALRGFSLTGLWWKRYAISFVTPIGSVPASIA